MRLSTSPSLTAVVLSVAMVAAMADWRMLALVLMFSWWWEYVVRVILHDDSHPQQGS